MYFSIESHEENKVDKSKQKNENKENNSNKYSVPTVAEDLKATELALTEIINEFEFARQQGNSLTHTLNHSLTHSYTYSIIHSRTQRIRFERSRRHNVV